MQIVGAASVAARKIVAREKQTDRAEPCPYNFFVKPASWRSIGLIQGTVPSQFHENRTFNSTQPFGIYNLDRFSAEADVHIVVEIVEIEDRSI
jgi:hypothetical protein